MPPLLLLLLSFAIFMPAMLHAYCRALAIPLDRNLLEIYLVWLDVLGLTARDILPRRPATAAVSSTAWMSLTTCMPAMLFVAVVSAPQKLIQNATQPHKGVASEQHNMLVHAKEAPGRGRGIFAARAISAGDVVMRASPILLYPQHGTAAAFCSHCLRAFNSLGEWAMR